ncbi:Hypothetical predicted protein, partial [Pelobates cultripes]
SHTYLGGAKTALSFKLSIIVPVAQLSRIDYRENWPRLLVLISPSAYLISKVVYYKCCKQAPPTEE